ncbi:U3 snoRNP protein [Pseudogymnoascus verrucosus]|uniref:U3 small nucleolar ribonucleoprotein protein MPP10 n=1 Tax=Pseudogymnoascus verrucosus TaxID=342668 RepID=A0A1B8GLJ0_9PEZI|nr:U3 snoRNP protein [Pseudogymnoascus verrucosus]OBT96704.1 U3 snoRNP protein [Pseudogymnoascus verrucosus]
MAQVSGSTSSSMTSTSHTMTAEPTNQKLGTPQSSYSAYAKSLLQALQPENRYKFIAPEKEICEGALDLAKSTLDGFAAQLYDEQNKRVEEERKDRKRKRGEAADGGELLKIRKVHTQGFAVEQVWEQARRVIDALRGDVERDLDELAPSEGDESESEDGEEGEGDSELDGMEFGEDGLEIGSEGDSAEGDEDQEEEMDVMEEGVDDDEDEDDMAAMMDGEDDLEDEDDEDAEDDGEEEEFVEDPHGLNDGFFSIDQFNKQTEFLELQDTAADPYTGEASDEEEIDWDADPMTAVAAAGTKSKKSGAADDESEDEDEKEDEDGPTFGNMDLNAPEGESDDEEDEDMEDVIDAPGDNTNDILYKDFFQPPARKVTKAEKQASYLARQEKKAKALPADDEQDVERAMADVRRDLFDDEEEDRSEDDLSDVDAADPKSRRSAHERRQAKLAEEIRRLEAASVQKREWTLSGEARAADRPQNSLLEQDLDFERTGKPVPVITAEVSESIEELIKRRIIAQEFDEVIRRRPDSDSVPDNARRGAFELEDTKAQQSLAEMYEEEHVKNNNPDTYMSKADDKLKKQHLEIEGLWKDVCGKLDALSSWHYKPKPPAPSLTVVADVATVNMEDAQPTMASGITGADSMLAPQEIYKAGKDKNSVDKGEIVPKSGAPIARQEMTREEKLRRRRREKERIKKRGGEVQNARPEGKKAKAKRETVEELKKAGVKVIGRRGDIKDVEGNKIKAAQITNGAGGFKL